MSTTQPHWNSKNKETKPTKHKTTTKLSTSTQELLTSRKILLTTPTEQSATTIWGDTRSASEIATKPPGWIHSSARPGRKSIKLASISSDSTKPLKLPKSMPPFRKVWHPTMNLRKWSPSNQTTTDTLPDKNPTILLKHSHASTIWSIRSLPTKFSRWRKLSALPR